MKRYTPNIIFALGVSSLLAVASMFADVRPHVDVTGATLSDGSVTNAKVADDTLTAAKFADGDWGDVSVSSNSVTVDANSVALTTDTTGNYVTSVAGGAGITDLSAASEGATPTISTDSSEADFIKSGTLACGASTQGKMEVDANGLQFCDNAATPTRHYAAFGNSSGESSAAADNSVTGTDIALTSNAVGDMMYYDGTDWVRLAAGSVGTKLLANGAAAPSWAAFNVSYILLCPSGPENVACKTFTDQGAGPTSAGTRTVRMATLNPSHVTQFRVTGLWGVAAVTGDLIVQCDTESTFTGATTMFTLTDPGTNVAIDSGWTALSTPGGDCTPSTPFDVFLRAAMINGNGSEDPALSSLQVAFR